MVSEQFPPLTANMATLGNNNSIPVTNNTRTQAQGTQAENRARSNQEPVFFNHSISVRLNDHNFLLWKQQVLAAIKENRLIRFIKEPPPEEYLNNDDRQQNRVNPIYGDWEVQDQLLVSWLLSSMTESLLTRMVGCNSARQIWESLEKHFTLQVSSKILEFRTKLQNLKKGNLSLNDYLLKVKQVVDHLASVGEVISDRDHVAAIFKGLPSEYDTFVISTNTRVENYTVGEIEALLLASESRIEKSGKEFEASANLTMKDQDPLLEANLAFRRYRQQQFLGRGNSQYNAGQFGFRNTNRGNDFSQSFNSNFGGRGNTNNSRGGRSGVIMNNRIQCQLCLRFGHTALDCFFRFDKAFSGPNQGTSSSSQTSQQTQSPQVNLTTTEAGNDSNWYPDSGATNHCTPQAQNLANCYDYGGQDQMLVGNGSGIKHINKVEQEELKEDPFPLLPFSEKNKARDFKLMMEKKRQDDMNNIEKQHNISAANNVRESEALKKSSYENMLAKMEKIQGGVNDLKQQDKVSTKPVEELESSKKKPEEDMKAYDLQENKKMVFIRSRL